MTSWAPSIFWSSLNKKARRKKKQLAKVEITAPLIFTANLTDFRSQNISHNSTMTGVRVGKDWSTKADILSGILQGSVLGLILFTIFINDLPECFQSCCKVFTDDTKIYDSACNCIKIQVDIYRLQEWFDVWNLYFNVTKCKLMHVERMKKLITQWRLMRMSIEVLLNVIRKRT